MSLRLSIKTLFADHWLAIEAGIQMGFFFSVIQLALFLDNDRAAGNYGPTLAFVCFLGLSWLMVKKLGSLAFSHARPSLLTVLFSMKEGGASKNELLEFRSHSPLWPRVVMGGLLSGGCGVWLAGGIGLIQHYNGQPRPWEFMVIFPWLFGLGGLAKSFAWVLSYRRLLDEAVDKEKLSN